MSVKNDFYKQVFPKRNTAVPFSGKIPSFPMNLQFSEERALYGLGTRHFFTLSSAELRIYPNNDNLLKIIFVISADL